MSMRIPLFLLLGTVLALEACNAKPMIEPSTPISNSQLKSANQWAELASETADQLAPTLKAMRRPVYVAGDDNSKFVAAFRDFLAKELNGRGFVVATHAADAAIINISTRVVKMRGPRKPPIPVGAIELAVALPVEVTTGMVTYLTRTPDTEVVVSTTVLDDQRLWFRRDHIFYVDDGEAPTYRSQPSNMMTNWQSSPAAQLRSVPVFADY